MSIVAKPFSLVLMGLVFLGCGKKEGKEISAVEEAIRMELKKPEGELTQADYQKVKRLSVYEVARPVEDITLVGELTNLEELDFAGGDISNPAPLGKLTKLWHLQISECKLQNLSALSGLDFLGFGLPPGSASLGEMVNQGRNNLQAPWLGLTSFFTLGLMLGLLVFVGEAIRDALDPRKTFI